MEAIPESGYCIHCEAYTTRGKERKRTNAIAYLKAKRRDMRKDKIRSLKENRIKSNRKIKPKIKRKEEQVWTHDEGFLSSLEQP
jgi:hypothetical protein